MGPTFSSLTQVGQPSLTIDFTTPPFQPERRLEWPQTWRMPPSGPIWNFLSDKKHKAEPSWGVSMEQSQPSSSRTEVLNLGGGVGGSQLLWQLCLQNIYIVIHNSKKITVMK